jgi:hypothetical protein
MNEKHYFGQYLVIGTAGDYSIMEQFGGYRMLKKELRPCNDRILL